LPTSRVSRLRGSRIGLRRGHGSDTSLRTSEDLTRETLALEANSEGHNAACLTCDAHPTSETEGTLRAAVDGAPGSFEANRKLGEFYLRAGRYKESVSQLQTAYGIDPANRDNEYQLAQAMKGAGDFSHARDHVQKLLATADTADLHRLAGELDEKLDDPLAAVHEFEQAVHRDPNEENYFAWALSYCFIAQSCRRSRSFKTQQRFIRDRREFSLHWGLLCLRALTTRRRHSVSAMPPI